MTRRELAAVVVAVAVSASGAAFGAFLAVSGVEAQIDKYFGGRPLDRLPRPPFDPDDPYGLYGGATCPD